MPRHVSARRPPLAERVTILPAAAGQRDSTGRPAGPLTGPLPGAMRVHLDELTGPLGIYQHARGRQPDPGQGYCTDDVARSAIVDVLQGHQLGQPAVATSLARSVTFLAEAFVPGTGRLRNFRDDDGNWLERVGSADAHSRGIQALGVVIAARAAPAIDELAARTLELALPAALELADLRPWAHAILGCVAALGRDRPPAAAELVLDQLAGRLFEVFASADDAEWPWPETTVTYENAVMAQALIDGGAWLADRTMIERGLAALDWLVAGQLAPGGHFEPVGNRGWWPRGARPARFDQQPIDAAALVDACAAAWRVTNERGWLTEMERAYAWFTGWNSGGLAVADPATGGCCDGLSSAGVNANQGAESTLAWLTATECVRATRSDSSSGSPRSSDNPTGRPAAGRPARDPEY